MRFFTRGPKGIVERAASLRRAGDFTGAIDVLADALTADPEDTAANAEMARALRLIGDPAGAEEHIRIALKTVLARSFRQTDTRSYGDTTLSFYLYTHPTP